MPHKKSPFPYRFIDRKIPSLPMEELKIIESGAEIPNMIYLKDRNLPMILLLLEKIEATGDQKLIPLLEA